VKHSKTKLVEKGKTSMLHQHFPILPNFNPPFSVLNTEHLGYGVVHGIVTDMLGQWNVVIE
jgi:hypothetical protein